MDIYANLSNYQFNGALYNGYQCFQLHKANGCNKPSVENKLMSILEINAVCFLQLLSLAFDEGCSLQFSVTNDIGW